MIEDFKHRILREQIRLAMEQLPTMQGASLIVALVLCYTVRNIVPYANIFQWGALVLGIAFGRVALYLRFSKVRDGSFEGDPWKNAYLISALISGIVWGLSAFMIFPSGNSMLISLFVLVMGGLTAGTTLSHVSIRFASTLWAGPAMLFYAIRCSMESGQFGYTVGSLIIIYLLAVQIHAFKHSEFITSSIALRFENLNLLEEVRSVNDSLFQKIVEHKIAQKALRESEEKFRLSPDWITLNRVSDGMYLDINDGFRKITGYTRDDVTGKTCLELNIWYDPEDRERLVARLRDNGFAENQEARFCGKDGRVIIGLMSARMLHINQEDIILMFVRDITARMQAESEREKLVMELQEALANVRTLRGLLPVCAWCGKIRDDRGYWQQMEAYISEHSEVDFSHGICPECAKKVREKVQGSNTKSSVDPET